MYNPEKISQQHSAEIVEKEDEQKEWMFEPKIDEISFEDKIESEEKLDNLGEIMEGADFDWWLDGGLNVPIHIGEYYRKHKDIEISINKNDIEKLYVWLKANGYNIFDVSISKNWKKLSDDDIKDFNITNNYLISDTKEMGEYTSREIELHIHQKDREGNQIVERVMIPKKYFENLSQYETISGHKINLSHPLVTAFHKLKMERGNHFESLESKLSDIRKSYDIEDLKLLRPVISDKDMEVLAILITEQKDKRLETIEGKLEEIYNALDFNAPKEEIQKIINEKMGAEERKNFKEAIEKIVSFIDKNRNAHFDEFCFKFEELLGVEEYLNRLENKFKIVKESGKSHRGKYRPHAIDNLLTKEEKSQYEYWSREQKEKEKIEQELYGLYKKIKKENENIQTAKEWAVQTILGEYLLEDIDGIIEIAINSNSEEEYVETLREKLKNRKEMVINKIKNNLLNKKT